MKRLSNLILPGCKCANLAPHGLPSESLAGRARFGRFRRPAASPTGAQNNIKLRISELVLLARHLCELNQNFGQERPKTEMDLRPS